MELMRAGEQEGGGSQAETAGRRRQHQIRPVRKELEQGDKRAEEEGGGRGGRKRGAGKRGIDENERHVQRKWCEKKNKCLCMGEKEGTDFVEANG